ncbi:hypothetical protein K503DRAFT_158314 [Rhizopogon vinicolor AM-OR11-026]|uniref:Uncharacterized protein n=1 Tax=Rhizopogon vinicolor AM-OR11-026 TaxID=1314800 RepID=A0A1B7N0W0_9AGAM|nr:hypothetical protein K503DRAFT_158314 [Rhizopogon vinicolor AM-OR11-026]
MKFISLAAIIMFVAAMVAALDTTMIGHACSNTNNVGCETIAGHNGGLPFAYACGSDNTITGYLDCTCSSCCQVQGENVACVRNQ